MEDQILTYEDADLIDDGLYNFINCKLKVDFGPFRKGQTFDWVNMSTGDAVFVFCERDHGEEVRVPFKIVAA